MNISCASCALQGELKLIKLISLGMNININFELRSRTTKRTQINKARTSSTSISVPAEKQNGMITGYTIVYQAQTENHNGNKQAGPAKRKIEITGLRKYVVYDITVLASTVKGAGPPSSPGFEARTDKDSKYISCWFWYTFGVIIITIIIITR